MKKWAKLLLVGAGLLITARLTLAVEPLSSTNYTIPRSAQPGNGQGSSASTNYNLRSTVGEIQSSTLTSTNFYAFAGAQHVEDIPKGITTLTALAGYYPGEINLQWITPGDDDDHGHLSKGARVYIATTTNISDSQNAAYWHAKRNNSEIQFTTSGASSYQNYSVTGLDEGVTYYFRIWVKNHQGNWNSLSTGATGVATVSEIGVIILGTDTFNFGNMDLSSSAVTTSSFTIRNIGNVKEDYLIRGTTLTPNTPWALSTAPGTDQFMLRGGFSPSQPAISSFGSEDTILFNDQTSDSTKFAIGASSGTTVPINEDKYLWLRLDTPLMTSTTWQQDIRVTITGSRAP